MASGGAADDECVICTEPMKFPRILTCNHAFCLVCLEKLESRKVIKCPVCREDTTIPEGMHVKHLRKRQLRGHTAHHRVVVVKSWTMEHVIQDVTVDEDAGIVFVGSRDPAKPIKMYSLTGEYSGHWKPDRQLKYPKLSLDTKRNMLLAVDLKKGEAPYIIMFDMEGTQVASITCPQFKDLANICYFPHKDVYIVADRGAQRVFYVNPDNYKVCKTIEPRGQELTEEAVVNLACDPSGRTSVWAMCERHTSSVTLYDAEGGVIKVWDNIGTGLGQCKKPSGVAIDGRGRLVVSDTDNHRMVRIDPESLGDVGEWQVVTNTKQFGLGAPRMIHFTEDGLAVVIMWTKFADPQNVAIISGLC